MFDDAADPRDSSAMGIVQSADQGQIRQSRKLAVWRDPLVPSRRGGAMIMARRHFPHRLSIICSHQDRSVADA